MNLQARQVSLGYAGNPALQGVDLELTGEGPVALLGPNGAGKSSLLRVLAGLARPDSGTVLLEGRSLSDFSPVELATRVALVPQSVPFTFPFRVEEVVMMGRYPYQSGLGLDEERHREVVERSLRSTGLLALARRRVTELSGGEAQRVRIAQALAQETRWLLLDEPTAHLDISFQLEILELLTALQAERGVGVMLSLHDLGLAATFCRRVAVLQAGRLRCQGSPAQVLTSQLLSEVFGVEFDIIKSSEGSLRLFPRARVSEKNSNPVDAGAALCYPTYE